MTVDTNTMISITEANQNFSKVARVVDEHGTAVIKSIYNMPRGQISEEVENSAARHIFLFFL